MPNILTVTNGNQGLINDVGGDVTEYTNVQKPPICLIVINAS
jgi:hypothetical protein